MQFGNFRIMVGKDAKGTTVYFLHDNTTETLMPGSWTSMTAAMLHAAEIELERRQNVPYPKKNTGDPIGLVEKIYGVNLG